MTIPAPPATKPFRPNFINALASPEELGALPLVNDLIASLRPAVVVVTAAGQGPAFLAVCQSMQANGVQGETIGIDSWNNAAPAEFGESSIDLLYLRPSRDSFPSARLYSRWSGKVRPGGAILLEGLRPADRSYWEEIKANCPYLEWADGPALGVLRPGGGAAPPFIDALFSGDASAAAFYSHYYATQAALLSASVSATGAVDRLGRENQTLRAELRESRAERAVVAAEYRAAHSALASLREEAVHWEEQLEKERERRNLAFRQLEIYRESETRSAVEYSQAWREISALQTELERRNAEVTRLSGELARSQTASTPAAATGHDDLLAALQRNEQERLAMLNSFSWRITAPLRALLGPLMGGSDTGGSGR